MRERFLILTVALFLASCKSDNGSGTATAPLCSTSQLENEMSSLLSTGAGSEVPFTYAVERADGRQFVYNFGSSNLNTVYESASTSKLVTSVIILRLVDQGLISLTDKPQNHVPSWPLSASDKIYNMTLKDLLSFQSGMTDEILCLNLPGSNFETCAKSIASANSDSSYSPGSTFYYSGTHMQVAGLMAMYAAGASSWQDVFSSFKASTGLFPQAKYELPSSSNPRLAGGMTWTASEYLAFLKALKNGTLLSGSTMTELLKDQTFQSAIAYSPPKSDLNEDWHYGLGLWHECQSATYNCNASASRVSSPGAYGAYPFWDRNKNYFGIVARQGTLGTYVKGIEIERTVRSKAEAWASCSN